MAKHLPSPYSPGQLNPEAAGSNAMTPRASYLRRAADAMNSIATYQKKMITAKCQPLNSSPSAGSGSVLSIWPFYFRTGENTVGLRMQFGLLDTDYGSAVDPYVNIHIKLAADGSDGAEIPFHFNGRNPPIGVVDVINRTNIVSARFEGLSSNTEYYTEIEAADGCRLLFLSAWEIGERHADDSVTGIVDPTKFLADGPIYDEHVSDLLGAGSAHWKHGGTHYLTWNSDYSAGTSGEPITATSYTNVIDNASTTYSAATPGYTLAASYHGTATTAATGPAVRIAVRATRTSGAGNLSVRLFDGTNAIELTGITTGGQGDWYVGDAVIPQTTTKWDLQAKVSAGEFALSGVCVFAYKA